MKKSSRRRGLFLVLFLCTLELFDAIHEALDTLTADGVLPVTTLLEEGANDKRICVHQVVRDVVSGAARTDKNRDLNILLDILHLLNIGLATSAGSSDDETVSKEVLSSVSRLNNVDISSNGMRTVLLLDISEHTNVLSTDCLAIAKKITSATVDIAFICNMAENEAFNTNKVETSRLSDGNGLLVVGSEDLHTEGHLRANSTTDLGRSKSHGSDDLRTNLAAVRNIMHVLNHDSINATALVKLGLGDGLCDDVMQISLELGSARKSFQVHHTNNAVIQIGRSSHLDSINTVVNNK